MITHLRYVKREVFITVDVPVFGSSTTGRYEIVKVLQYRYETNVMVDGFQPNIDGKWHDVETVDEEIE